MIPVALIRHGPTDWNEQRRIQGHADRLLSDAGRATVAGWRLPEEFRAFDWFASPLSRAKETARLLGVEFETDPALIEMDWGDWEGHTHDELLSEYGEEMTRRTSMGLDLRPHNGETPRELRQRFAAWAAGTAARGRPAGAVAHQGIIRAALSLATGWDMIGKPPAKMDWASVHVFTVGGGGEIDADRLNISLEADQS